MAAEPGLSPPSPQVIEKIGQGDRLYLGGDYRAALFAYQDAVYLQPRYAPARVRLGRAYLAMRYPAQAIAQAEAALAEDPENAEAKKLLDEAKAAAAKAQASAPGAGNGTGAGAATTATSGAAAGGSAAAGKAAPRVYKLPPPVDAGAAHAGAAVAPVIVSVPAPLPDAPPPAAVTAPQASPAQQENAAQRYRAALGLLEMREFAKAVAELSDAILADPKLAVAHSARGSAQFGLGKYREAAEDYRTAIALDPKLGMPVYGLAECHRVLGEGKKAAELYDRYARSDAPDVRDDLRAVAVKRAQELR